MTTRRMVCQRRRAEIARRFLPGAVEARHHGEHHQHAEGQRPGELRAERGGVPGRLEAEVGGMQADADAEHEAGRDQAADHDIEDDAVAGEALAEGEAGQEGDDDGDHRHHHREPDRAVERALDVAGAHLGEQVHEPVQRESLHREDQPAAHVLERQDVDADHRAVEREDVEGEQRGEDVERPGTAALPPSATGRRAATASPAMAAGAALIARVPCARRRSAGSAPPWRRPRR